jgi:hypothetical protein
VFFPEALPFSNARVIWNEREDWQDERPFRVLVLPRSQGDEVKVATGAAKLAFIPTKSFPKLPKSLRPRY